MSLDDLWFVEVVDYDSDESAEPIKRLGPFTERNAEKTAEGLNEI